MKTQEERKKGQKLKRERESSILSDGNRAAGRELVLPGEGKKTRNEERKERKRGEDDSRHCLIC